MIMAAKRSVIMQIENVVNKNIDARNGNAQTESVGISDYIRDDVQSDCEKKAATVSTSNSVDMSDTIYGKPQNKKDYYSKTSVDIGVVCKIVNIEGIKRRENQPAKGAENSARKLCKGLPLVYGQGGIDK